jgi:hypothetical protein
VEAIHERSGQPLADRKRHAELSITHIFAFIKNRLLNILAATSRS